jgi:hypothetical protein
MHEVRRLPGSGPAGDDGPSDLRDDGTLVEGLLDGLLADFVPEPPGPLDFVARALEAHREHARAWYGDLIGPLGVPAVTTPQLVDALRPSDHAMRMVLLGPWGEAPEEWMRGARAQLLDDDRIELAGVEFGMAVASSPAGAAEKTLAGLDVSGPAWLRVPADPGWIEALDVIAQDGAERVALILPDVAEDSAHSRLAAMIQSLVSRNLSFCLVGAPGAIPIDLVTSDSAYGLLNLLCAAGRAVEAAAVGDLAAIGDNAARLAHLAGLLGQTDSETIIEESRRIGAEGAGAIRSRLERISCGSVRALVGDLERAGLIVPDVA